MPAGPGGHSVPDIVVAVVGDISDLLAKLDLAKEQIAKFAEESNPIVTIRAQLDKESLSKSLGAAKEAAEKTVAVYKLQAWLDSTQERERLDRARTIAYAKAQRVLYQLLPELDEGNLLDAIEVARGIASRDANAVHYKLKADLDVSSLAAAIAEAQSLAGGGSTTGPTMALGDKNAWQALNDAEVEFARRLQGDIGQFKMMAEDGFKDVTDAANASGQMAFDLEKTIAKVATDTSQIAEQIAEAQKIVDGFWLTVEMRAGSIHPAQIAARVDQAQEQADLTRLYVDIKPRLSTEEFVRTIADARTDIQEAVADAGRLIVDPKVNQGDLATANEELNALARPRETVIDVGVDTQKFTGDLKELASATVLRSLEVSDLIREGTMLSRRVGDEEDTEMVSAEPILNMIASTFKNVMSSMTRAATLPTTPENAALFDELLKVFSENSAALEDLKESAGDQEGDNYKYIREIATQVNSLARAASSAVEQVKRVDAVAVAQEAVESARENAQLEPTVDQDAINALRTQLARAGQDVIKLGIDPDSPIWSEFYSLREFLKDETIDVETTTDLVKEFTEQIAEAKALAALTDIRIPVSAETLASLQLVAEQLGLVSGDFATTSLAADDFVKAINQAVVPLQVSNEQIAEMRDQFLAAAKAAKSVELPADLRAQLLSIPVLLDAITANPYNIDLKVDVQKSLESLRVALADLSEQTILTSAIESITGPASDPLAEVKKTSSDMLSAVEKSVAMLQKLGTSKVKIDTSELLAQTTMIRNWIARPETIPVDANISEALAKLETLRAAANFQARIGGLAGGTGSNGLFSTAVAAAAGGGGGKGESLLSELGWGKGAGIPVPFLGAVGGGMAGFGSMLSLAGFGGEHVLATGAGLVGSAGGALLGGGLLASGALSTTAVGLGTDLAGIGQAAGDIKNVVSAQNSLNQAIQTYGANSTQAAAAQNTLNGVLASFNPVARQAVSQAATAVQQFKSLFDFVTGQAEKTGAQIITQGIKVGEAFLPTIGKFAAENMKIIQKDIQPLFSWLTNPGAQGGLGIFTELEQIFQNRLPTAIHALTQGIELFARTMGLVAPMTGNLLDHVDKFLTSMNGADWSKWSSGVEKLVGIFRVWDQFFVYLFKDLFKLFSLTAGLAAGPGGIIPILTGYLKELNGALATTGKNSNLGEIFKLHKQEVTDILQAAIQIGIAFGKMYIAISPIFLKITVAILDVVAALTKLISHIPVASAFVGMGLLLTQMGILGPLLKGAGKDAGLMGSALGKIGFSGLFSGKDTGFAAKGIRSLFGLSDVATQEDILNSLDATMQGVDGTMVKVQETMASLDGSIQGFSATMTEANQPTLTLSTSLEAVAKQLLELNGQLVPTPEEIAVLGEAASTASGGISRAAVSIGEVGLALDGLTPATADAASLATLAEAAAVLNAELAPLAAEGVAAAAALGAMGVAGDIAGVGGDVAGAGLDVATAGVVGLDVASGGLLFVVGAAIAAIVGGLIYLATDWSKTMKAIKDEVQKLGLAPLFQKVVSDIKGAFSSFESWWKSTWSRIAPVVRAAWQGIETAIKSAIAQIDIAIKDFTTTNEKNLGGFTKWWKEHGDQVIQVFKAMAEATKINLEVMVGIVVGVTATIEILWRLFGRSLIDTLKAATVTLAQIWKLTFDGLALVFKLAWDGIVMNFNIALDILTGQINKIPGDIGNGLKQGFNAIVDFGKQVFHLIVEGFRNTGTWLVQAGKDLVQGFLNGIHNKIPMVHGIAGDIAGAVLGPLAFVLKLASPSRVTYDMGQNVTLGLANGITSGSGNVIKAAQGVAQSVKTAFSGLGGTSAVAKMFSELSTAFTNLDKAASHAQNVGADSLAIGNALAALGDQAGPISTGLHNVANAFKPFGKGGAIEQLNTVLTPVGNLFNNFARDAQNASKITSSGLSDMYNALYGMAVYAKPFATGVGIVEQAFSGLDSTKGLKSIHSLNSDLGSVGNLFSNFAKLSKASAAITVPAMQSIYNALNLIHYVAKPFANDIAGITTAFGALADSKDEGEKLGDLDTVFQKLSTLFQNFGSTAKNTGGVSAASLLLIAQALTNLKSSADFISTTILQVDADFKKLGDMHDLFGKLNNLMVLFGKLGQVFTDLGKAAVASNNVSNAPLQNMKTQIGNLASSLSNLPTAISAANGPAVSDLQSLVNNMTTLLTSQSTINKFTSAGVAMMQGVALGITQGTSAVTAALGSSATKAQTNFHFGQLKAGSPSRLFVPDGIAIMEGVAKGVTDSKGVLQTALTGAIPRVPSYAGQPTSAGSGHGMNITANFTINAPGGDAKIIKNAIEQDSAKNFAKAALTAMRAGAGTVY